jgi:hypothetical protein
MLHFFFAASAWTLLMSVFNSRTFWPRMAATAREDFLQRPQMEADDDERAEVEFQEHVDCDGL